MPIHTSWKSMAKGMKKTYAGQGKTKCRPFTDGSKVCMSKKAWSVFYATINKMGADETKPRPKSKVQESTQKIVDHFLLGKFSEGAWKLPKAITKTIFFKGFYVPIPKVGKFKGKKGTYRVTKRGKAITVHRTYKIGKRKAWSREVGTKKQWARMGLRGAYKGPMIGTAMMGGFSASKQKIVDRFLEAHRKKKR